MSGLEQTRWVQSLLYFDHQEDNLLFFSTISLQKSLFRRFWITSTTIMQLGLSNKSADCPIWVFVSFFAIYELTLAWLDGLKFYEHSYKGHCTIKHSRYCVRQQQKIFIIYLSQPGVQAPYFHNESWYKLVPSCPDPSSWQQMYRRFHPLLVSLHSGCQRLMFPTV